MSETKKAEGLGNTFLAHGIDRQKLLGAGVGIFHLLLKL